MPCPRIINRLTSFLVTFENRPCIFFIFFYLQSVDIPAGLFAPTKRKRSISEARAVAALLGMHQAQREDKAKYKEEMHQKEEDRTRDPCSVINVQR